MKRKLSSLPKKVLRRVLRMTSHDRCIKKLYREKACLEAYCEHTDIRVDCDPHEAVGGRWEEIGKLQFDFLLDIGLQPHHRLLDIGCGTLRGGRHFIKYLDAGNYSGMDISPRAIEYGRQLVEHEDLSEKQPRLLVSRNKNLRFKEFDGEVFDYLLAQSVFTHLKSEHIEECFRHIAGIMKKDTIFVFTFNEASEFKQTGLKGFSYPFVFFQSLADEYGFNLKDRSEDYKHPVGQHMAMLSKREITHW